MPERGGHIHPPGHFCGSNCPKHKQRGSTTPPAGGGRSSVGSTPDPAAATTASREAEIRALAATNGRRLMSDGYYSTVVLGWSDIHMLLDEIDQLREIAQILGWDGRTRPSRV